MSNFKKGIVVSCVMSLFSPLTSASPVDYYYQQLQLKNDKPLALTANNHIVEEYYDQFVDHRDASQGTFAQRYFVDESFSTSNDSPVFLYLCGEATCGPQFFNTKTIRGLAEKYHAKIVALEHRYYGKSLPRKTFSTADLKYLTIANALRDVASFEVDVRRTNHWTGKWIVFGGSYSGSLSANYRLTFPMLVAGSLASSAVVRVKEAFDGFDEHVTKMAGPECAGNMRKVVREIESAMKNDEKHLAEIKDMFRLSALKDNTDFLAFLADVGGGAIQFGMKDFFCSSLATSPTPLEGYAFFSNTALDLVGVEPISLTPQGALSEDPKDYEKLLGMRQWAYQSCTELGSWQTANPDPDKSTRSQLLDLNYYKNVCQRLFGIESKVDPDNFIKYSYTALLKNGSDIFFTNGSNDPWSLLSLSEANGNATNRKMSYAMIEGGAHCDDLRKDKNISESLKNARNKLDELIKVWIEK